MRTDFVKQFAALLVVLVFAPPSQAQQTDEPTSFECKCANNSASLCSQVDVSGGVSEVDCEPNADFCSNFALEFDILSGDISQCAEPFFACDKSKSSFVSVGGSLWAASTTTSSGLEGSQLLFDELNYRLTAVVSGQLTEFFGSVSASCTPVGN